ncbi:hypothetical protein V7S43_011949 [Phytophthora oleae]|uniref:Tetratricopeptide repeat protein n=1 Tax=Phytophthora oleae TaxID=2107226 RepID=A0ABD3F963_9STRA
MESGSALLRDVAGGQSCTLQENDIINRVESVKQQLLYATISPASRAVALCHVIAESVAFLVQYRSVAALAASSKWHKRVLLLETAVASAFTTIGGSDDTNFGRRDLCYMYQSLLQRLWDTQQAGSTVAVMIKVGVLLAICWLQYDRVGALEQAQKLLKQCCDFCLEHETTKTIGKWPLFLLGMVQMVDNQGFKEALQSFQSAVKLCGHSEEDAPVFYWFAVVLIHNGASDDAATALSKCIRANYEPVACLSLQALMSLQAKDFHAAAGQLQRVLAIDFAQPRSLFNYSLLMQRMDSCEEQQQLLEYVVNPPESGEGGKAEDEKRRKADLSDLSTALFDETSLKCLIPSQLTSVKTSVVYLHLAVAAMENDRWQESKQYFEEFLHREDPHTVLHVPVEAARDYVYVLLQCKLPSLALSKCERYLLEFKDTRDNVALPLLHLYKADALLCLERVKECLEYLQEVVQPKIQHTMAQETHVAEEITSCHVQLVNNLAVVVACCSGAEAAISILREGLQQYPDCLAIKFNLVLLLWRKSDKVTAVSVWMKARGLDPEAKIRERGEENPVSIAVACQNAAMSAGSDHDRPISEHVQGPSYGEGGVSTQQLVYLDALILDYWCKMRNSQVVDSSIQYVEYIESLGTTKFTRHI